MINSFKKIVLCVIYYYCILTTIIIDKRDLLYAIYLKKVVNIQGSAENSG